MKRSLVVLFASLGLTAQAQEKTQEKMKTKTLPVVQTNWEKREVDSLVKAFYETKYPNAEKVENNVYHDFFSMSIDGQDIIIQADMNGEKTYPLFTANEHYRKNEQGVIFTSFSYLSCATRTHSYGIVTYAAPQGDSIKYIWGCQADDPQTMFIGIVPHATAVDKKEEKKARQAFADQDIDVFGRTVLQEAKAHPASTEDMFRCLTPRPVVRQP